MYIYTCMYVHMHVYDPIILYCYTCTCMCMYMHMSEVHVHGYVVYMYVHCFCHEVASGFGHSFKALCVCIVDHVACVSAKCLCSPIPHV